MVGCAEKSKKVTIKQGKNTYLFRDCFKLKIFIVLSGEGLFDFYLDLFRGRNRF